MAKDGHLRWEDEAATLRLRLARLEEDVAKIHGCLPNGGSTGSRLGSAIRPALGSSARDGGQSDRSDAGSGHSAQNQATAQDALGPMVRNAEERLRCAASLACSRVDEAGRNQVERASRDIRELINKEYDQLLHNDRNFKNMSDTGCSTASTAPTSADVGETLAQAEIRLVGRIDEMEVSVRDRCCTLERRISLLDEAILSSSASQVSAAPAGERSASEEWWRREVMRLDGESARSISRLDHLETRVEEAVCRGEVERLRASVEAPGSSRGKLSTGDRHEDQQVLMEHVAQLDGELGALKVLCREARDRAASASEGLERCSLWKQEAEELRMGQSQVHAESQAIRRDVDVLAAVHRTLPQLQQRVEELSATRACGKPGAPPSPEKAPAGGGGGGGVAELRSFVGELQLETQALRRDVELLSVTQRNMPTLQQRIEELAEALRGLHSYEPQFEELRQSQELFATGMQELRRDVDVLATVQRGFPQLQQRVDEVAEALRGLPAAASGAAAQPQGSAEDVRKLCEQSRADSQALRRDVDAVLAAHRALPRLQQRLDEMEGTVRLLQGPVAAEPMQKNMEDIRRMCDQANLDGQALRRDMDAVVTAHRALPRLQQQVEELAEAVQAVPRLAAKEPLQEEVQRLCQQLHRDGLALRRDVDDLATAHVGLGPLQNRVEELAKALQVPQTRDQDLGEIWRQLAEERHEREDALRLLADALEGKLQRVLAKVDRTLVGICQSMGSQSTSSTAATSGSAQAPSMPPVRDNAPGEVRDYLSTSANVPVTNAWVRTLRATPTVLLQSVETLGSGVYPTTATVVEGSRSRALSEPPVEPGEQSNMVSRQPVAASPLLSGAMSPQPSYRRPSSPRQQARCASSASPVRRRVSAGVAGGPVVKEAARRQVAVPVDVVGSSHHRSSSSSPPRNNVVRVQERDRYLGPPVLADRSSMLDDSAVLIGGRVPMEDPLNLSNRREDPLNLSAGPLQQTWPARKLQNSITTQPAPPAPIEAAGVAGTLAEPAVCAAAHPGIRNPAATVETELCKVFETVHERLARRRLEMASSLSAQRLPLLRQDSPAA